MIVRCVVRVQMLVWEDEREMETGRAGHRSARNNWLRSRWAVDWALLVA